MSHLPRLVMHSPPIFKDVELATDLPEAYTRGRAQGKICLFDLLFQVFDLLFLNFLQDVANFEAALSRKHAVIAKLSSPVIFTGFWGKKDLIRVSFL